MARGLIPMQSPSFETQLVTEPPGVDRPVQFVPRGESLSVSPLNTIHMALVLTAAWLSPKQQDAVQIRGAMPTWRGSRRTISGTNFQLLPGVSMEIKKRARMEAGQM